MVRGDREQGQAGTIIVGGCCLVRPSLGCKCRYFRSFHLRLLLPTKSLMSDLCRMDPPPPRGYLARKTLVFCSLERVGTCKIFIANGLPAKYRFQASYWTDYDLVGAPRLPFMLCIQYSGLGGTHETCECAGLARGFDGLGLDRFLDGRERTDHSQNEIQGF